MKRFCFLPAILFVALLSIHAIQPDESDVQKVGRTVFEALQKNDSLLFKNCYISSADFAIQIDSTTESPEKKLALKEKASQHFLDSIVGAEFVSLKKKAKEMQFSWANATIDSISVRQREFDGLNSFRFDVFFSEQKRGFRLSSNKILKTKEGWKLSNNINLGEILK